MEVDYKIQNPRDEAASGQFPASGNVLARVAYPDDRSSMLEPARPVKTASQGLAGLASEGESAESLLARIKQLAALSEIERLASMQPVRSRRERKRLGIRYYTPATTIRLERDDEQHGNGMRATTFSTHRGKRVFTEGNKARYGQRTRAGAERLAHLFEQIK